MRTEQSAIAPTAQSPTNIEVLPRLNRIFKAFALLIQFAHLRTQARNLQLEQVAEEPRIPAKRGQVSACTCYRTALQQKTVPAPGETFYSRTAVHCPERASKYTFARPERWLLRGAGANLPEGTW